MTYNFTIRSAGHGKKPYGWAVACEELGSVYGTSGSPELARKEADRWRSRWTKSGHANIQSEVVAGEQP